MIVAAVYTATTRRAGRRSSVLHSWTLCAYHAQAWVAASKPTALLRRAQTAAATWRSDLVCAVSPNKSARCRSAAGSTQPPATVSELEHGVPPASGIVNHRRVWHPWPHCRKACNARAAWHEGVKGSWAQLYGGGVDLQGRSVSDGDDAVWV